MRLWRRRPAETMLSASPPLPVLAPRIERALVVLAAHAQQLDGRLDRLEDRLDQVAIEFQEAAVQLPNHADVLEVRLHSAKLAGELARVTVELRAEIERAVQQVNHAPSHGMAPRRASDTVIDLASVDTRPADIRHRGTGDWAATA